MSSGGGCLQHRAYTKGCASCREVARQYRAGRRATPEGQLIEAGTKVRYRAKHPHPGNHAHRARSYGVDYAPVNALTVYARDNWICQICGKPIDPCLPYPHPMSKSLDHRVPLSKGGPHTYANTQGAHLTCNTRKGADAG